ncbi:MAG: hypothetical protein JWQ27_701 [Ferruginibacter sp.]|nr:hypothetical protein [Ferruginibacter sp.]
MKKIGAVAVMISMAFLFSCNSNTTTSEDPKAVLSAFVEALARKDIATARRLSTTESSFFLEKMEIAFKKSDKEPTELFDRSKITYGEATINGDNATVPVTVSGETVNYALRKEAGQWKVNFDFATMAGVAMDKMKEKGISGIDSLQKGMGKLKNINLDSLKNVLQNAMSSGMDTSMKSLDSLKKVLQKIH